MSERTTIEPYEPAPLSDGAALEQTEDGSNTEMTLGRVLLALRRRWLLVLPVWIGLSALATVAIWKTVQPTYRATAVVEVAPVVPAILFEEISTQLPNYETYLRTQAEIVSSRPVLQAALADPILQDGWLAGMSDPIAALRSVLQVEDRAYTHLLEIGVEHESRETALQLTRAVLDAYLAQAAGQETQTERNRREALLREKQRLSTTIARLGTQIRQLAEEYGTESQDIFNARRQGLEQSITETRQALEQTDMDILQIGQRIANLDAGALPAELSSAREELIDADPGVRWVQKEIDTETAKLARLRLSLPEDHPDMKAVKANLDHLQTELAHERTRAATTADQDIKLKHHRLIADARQRLQGELQAAEQRRQVLQQRLDVRDAEGMAVGRQGLDIQALHEQREMAKIDYARVTDALKRLEVESQRPTRISEASAPEIRPDGVRDKRKKMAILATVTLLCVACLLGLLRDMRDPYLHNTEQVESGVGLRMLGAVPAVAELQAGQITREHFLESYRLIRTNLAAMGPDGNPPGTILITSAQAAEGKTSLAVSLAISLAEPGARVLLIDGDIQAPQIGRLMNVEPRGDLHDVLIDARPIQDCITPTNVPGVDLLTGHSNVDAMRTLLNMRTAKNVIREATNRKYDHIVVDSPPALGAADSLVWAHAVDGVIIASLVGYSDRKAIRMACQRLHSVGARMLGSVIANVSVRESYYSYSATSGRSESPLAISGRRPSRRTPPLVHLPGNGDTNGRGRQTEPTGPVGTAK